MKQDGFEIKMIEVAPSAEPVLGVAAGGVLTIGNEPDEYFFGAIGPDRILLRPFSGRGCSLLLTRKRRSLSESDDRHGRDRADGQADAAAHRLDDRSRRALVYDPDHLLTSTFYRKYATQLAPPR